MQTKVNDNDLLKVMLVATKEIAGIRSAKRLQGILVPSIQNVPLFSMLPDAFQIDTINKILISHLRTIEGTLPIREWLVYRESREEYVSTYRSYWIHDMVKLGVI